MHVIISGSLFNESSSFSDREFDDFQRFIHRQAGIHLSLAKKSMVAGRLARRLRELNIESYGDYFRYLNGGGHPEEMQVAVDLLTTNETYFFREPKHFEYLAEYLKGIGRSNAPVRVWSAACSSGEEPYTIAMVMAEQLGDSPWEVVASDVSERMVRKAEQGHYSLERAGAIPQRYLVNYCLRGVGSQEGTFLIASAIRSRVHVMRINLNAPLPELGRFDVIFLRNVMIYFDLATKREVIGRLLPALKPAGLFIIGHSESLNGVTDDLRSLLPSIYRKPGQ